MPDVQVTNEGTMFAFDLLTPEAEAWVNEHVQGPMFLGAFRLMVEHRYARELAQGMLDADLEVV